MTYIINDGGRSGSTRPRQKKDCVVRAVAIAFRLKYDEAYDLLARHGRRSHRGTPKKVVLSALSTLGTRTTFPSQKGVKRLNLETFAATIGAKGRWAVSVAGHMTAVVDGAVMDVDPVRPSACVYAAWGPLASSH